MTRPKTTFPAATWGVDESTGREVYLAQFKCSAPAVGASCPQCSYLSNEKDTERREASWEKHSLKHRIWRYADTDELYGDWRSQHRLCSCKVVYYDSPPIWCQQCDGYIRLDYVFAPWKPENFNADEVHSKRRAMGLVK